MSWSTLAQVQPVKVKDRVVPQYADGVLKLNATEVKLQGFMMPLEMGDRQKQFVLTAMPQSCAFCLPGGPEQLVLVQAKVPVKYTMEPVILSGKLAVLKDDPNGLYYRLDDAVITTAKRPCPVARSTGSSRRRSSPRSSGSKRTRCRTSPRRCTRTTGRSSRPTTIPRPASRSTPRRAARSLRLRSRSGPSRRSVTGLASADPLLPSLALTRFASRAPPLPA